MAWGLVAGWLAALAVAAPVDAHWLRPEQVIAMLESADSRQRDGVVDASRSVDQPRLLVVSVGSAWVERPASQRRELAMRWRRHWREAVPSGLLAIVEVESKRSLVGFDAAGRPLLH
jgi:hypothetical protein